MILHEKNSSYKAVIAQTTQVDAQTRVLYLCHPFLLNNASNPPFSLPSFYDNKNNHWVHQLRIGTALSNIAGVTLQ
jgi:hypothetical protein